MGVGQRILAGGLALLPLLLSLQPAANYLGALVLLGGLAQHAQVRQARKGSERVI